MQHETFFVSNKTESVLEPFRNILFPQNEETLLQKNFMFLQLCVLVVGTFKHKHKATYARTMLLSGCAYFLPVPAQLCLKFVLITQVGNLA